MNVTRINPISEIPIEEDIQSLLDEYASCHANPVLLEAGCGSSSHFALDAYRLAGIDISQSQLDRNTRLDEAILGSIQEYNFVDRKFDVIVCWNVLEHVPDPLKALENLAHALRDDGLLIVEVPNPLSLKGLVTKFTPHFVHVWFYRYVRNIKDAGRHDTAPFKTFLRFSLSPIGLRRFAALNDLKVECLRTYAAAWTSSRKMRLVNGILVVVAAPIRLLTLMRFNPLRVNDGTV
ncbi:MAG: class I SAM-dependent methyltransferase [Candidatus Hydrogenedentes bacterium]|nr:class I SAM-dependent methyltransferase [Candidatus Hydrogenedentota bacterium]